MISSALCLFVRTVVYVHPPLQAETSGWAVQVSKASPSVANVTSVFCPDGTSVLGVGPSSVPVDRWTSTRTEHSVLAVVFSTVPTKEFDAASNFRTSLAPLRTTSHVSPRPMYTPDSSPSSPSSPCSPSPPSPPSPCSPPRSDRACSPSPSDLETLVLDCLTKDPEDRIQSAEEFVARLDLIEFKETWSQERAERWWSEAAAD